MIYRFGNTSVDTLRSEIRRNGETVSLRRKSFEILVYLLRRPGRVVTKTELLDAMWADKVVTEGSIKSCIAEIRSAIGDSDRELIRTVPRRGYMLEASLAKQSPSILVAPIEDQSKSGDSAYIADGLTEEITIELSRIDNFRVISHASARRLKGESDTLKDKASELGVDYVLTGSLRRSGDKLRVMLQLQDVDSRNSRWSERFSGSLVDVFDMQDEIAFAVAGEVAQHLSLSKSGDKERIEDPRVVESYLQARFQMWRFSGPGLQQAERHLRNGLDLVGPSTRLLATLGHVYARYSEIGLDQTGEFLERGMACVEEIFERDPNSSRGQGLLGMIRFHSGEIRTSLQPLERSLEYGPTDPDALMLLGYLYALVGRNKVALRLFKNTLAIDPLTPINHCMPGFVALLEGRNAEALPHYQRFFSMDPYNAFAAWTLGHVLLRNGRLAEASAVIGELNVNHPDSVLSQLAFSTLNGVQNRKRPALNAISAEVRAAARHSEFLSREITHSLALAGETNEALDWLENTVRIGNTNYPFWAWHNRWVDSLRGRSRFEAILRKMEKEWRSVADID